MFKKPVWDDLIFVTRCIILLEVHQKMVHCRHKGMDMVNQYSGRLWWLNDAQSVPRKYPPHHYTTTTSLNRWDKAGWSMLSCSLHQILTLHLNVAAEIKTHQTRQRFSIFCCPVLVILCELYPPCAVLIWPERHRCGLLLLESICFRVRCVVCSEMVFFISCL